MKVWGEVPDSWEERIRKAMKMEGWDTLSAYVRDLIREDLKKKGLLGVRNGESEAVLDGISEFTKEFQKEFRESEEE